VETIKAADYDLGHCSPISDTKLTACRYLDAAAFITRKFYSRGNKARVNIRDIDQEIFGELTFWCH